MRSASPPAPSPTPTQPQPTPPPTTNAPPVNLIVAGIVWLLPGQYDKIYGGTGCQGTVDEYAYGDTRLMSLEEGADVVVRDAKSKTLSKGVLSVGRFNGTMCEMSFTVPNVP